MADFGLSKSTYEKMYFRQDKNEGVKLPIKWMALESLEDAVFTEKTDVVSKGQCMEVLVVTSYFCGISVSNGFMFFSGHLESLVGRCSVEGNSLTLGLVP